MKLPEYISRYRQIKKEKPSEGCRFIDIAILRSFSCETVESILAVTLMDEGLRANVKIGAYGQFWQESYQAADLFASDHNNPRVIIFALLIEDICPSLFEELNAPERVISEVTRLIDTVKNRFNGTILIHNFTVPYTAPAGILQSQQLTGVNNLLRQINLQLVQCFADDQQVWIVDIERLIAKIGEENAYDPTMRLAAKNPYTFLFYQRLAHEYTRQFKALLGIRKKCVVLDLDNTLWKGVIGEDGFAGIQVHTDFQKQLLHLHSMGVLLAVCSKNNPDEAMEVLQTHPDMVLKPEHFACIKINWEDKADNLLSIAEELSLGLDSFVFIDDNPAECRLVKALLPQVAVLELPSNYALYADVIKNIDGFDFLYLTDDDKNRMAQYTQQRQRVKLESEATDLDQYLTQLEMKAIISEAGPYSLPRVAQLTQKTNQFTLTARRYDLQSLCAMSERGYQIYVLSLQDIYGEIGLTGAVIIKPSPDVWTIDTFLLSCRVLGRRVEYALLWYVLQQAKKNGIKRVVGLCTQTERNIPAQSFYESAGFQPILTEPIAKETSWLWETDKTFEKPSCVQVSEAREI